MKSALIAACLLCLPLSGYCVSFQKIFAGKDGCFLLFDLQTSTVVAKYNEEFCAKRISPASTFKIPIALMAFEQDVLESENTVIKWDGVNRRGGSWNQDQTPVTWLRYSVVWVSQWLTPQIGMDAMKKHLADFRYGNQDLSGGVQKAWLGSSLKISAHEQAQFLARFWNGPLGISPQSVELTKKCLPLRKTTAGGILRAKTGSGFFTGGDPPGPRRIGWFAGYLKSGAQQYVFVTNFEDKHLPDEPKSGGERARVMTEEILNGLGL